MKIILHLICLVYLSYEKELGLDFLHLAGKLKTVRRHSWPEGIDNPRESVADHSWRVILMIMMYADKLDNQVDILKCIRMAAIHDLPEAITGDIALVFQDTQSNIERHIAEMKAMKSMSEMLDDISKDEFYEIYQEYERQDCYEAQFVKALDKLEAFLQHNEDPLDTWLPNEKVFLFQHKYLMKYCEFDSFLKKIATKVIEEGIKKLKDGGENIEELQKQFLCDNNE